MKPYKLITAILLVLFLGSTGYAANIYGLSIQGVVQKIAPETGNDSLTVRDDSLWIVIDDTTRISFIAGDHGGARLQGGINETIEFAYDSIFVDADTNTATPIILFGGYGGALRWNRATDKMQFSNDLSAWSDIGTSSGISESDYNNLIKNGSELKEKLDSTAVKIPTATLADSANGGAIRSETTKLADSTVGGGVRSETTKLADSTVGGSVRAESAQGVVGKAVNSSDPADQEVLTYYTTGDTLGWTSGTSLTEEEVEDFAGGMLGGTETRITVTYQDGTNDIDFVVDDMNDDVPESGDFGAGADLDADGGITDQAVLRAHIDSTVGITVTHLHRANSNEDDSSYLTKAYCDANYTGAGVAYDDIGDPDASGSITMGAHTGTYTSATSGWGGLIINNTVAEQAASGELLTLKVTDAADIHHRYLVAVDGSDTVAIIGHDGIYLGTAAQADSALVTKGYGDANFTGVGASVDLTSEVTGILPEANGGTGDSDLDDLVGASTISVSGGTNKVPGGDVTFSVAAGSINQTQIGTNGVGDDEIDYSAVTLGDFDYQTAWRVFYSNGDGDVTELALGADGTYLESNGVDQVPSFTTPGGGGDVTDVIGGAGLVDDGNTGAITVDMQIGSWPLDLNADSVWLDSTEIVTWPYWTAGYDSVDNWDNLVNDDRDSVLAFSPIVSEAKDSLTSWANEVNAATDSLASWANEVNTNTDHAADNSQAHTDYMLNTGDIATGVYDLGGTTSFEITNSDNPTTDADGEIAWDANDEAIEIYSGDEGESALIPFYQKIDACIFAPDAVADVITLLKVDALLYPHGIEIDQLSFTLPADAAYDIGFHEWTGADPPVFSAQIDSLVTTASDAYIEDGTPVDGAIAADATIRANIRSTDVDWVHIQIIFHVTEGN